MVVASEDNREDYAGNDVTVAFAIDFYFQVDADIRAVLYNSDTDVTTELVIVTHYTLAGAGDEEGGTLTMETAPTSDETLTILRDMTVTQETDYVENSTFPADSHEDALDKLTMIVQQFQEQLDRVLKLNLVDSDGVSVELPAPVANMIIGWDSDATALENKTTASGLDLLSEVTIASTGTLTVSQVSGTILTTYGQSAENTQTLPTAAKGMNGIVTIGQGGLNGAFHLKAGPSDKMKLNGTWLDDGDKASIVAPAAGDHFTFVATKTGASTYDWIVERGRGDLVDGGA